MLVISRRLDESFMIGDEIVVTVAGIKGNQVRIGIDAPTDIPVHREEIYKRIAESDEATMSAKKSLIDA